MVSTLQSVTLQPVVATNVAFYITFGVFVVAWLDRINVGFARLQMVKEPRFQRRGVRIRCGDLLRRLPAVRDTQQFDP